MGVELGVEILEYFEEGGAGAGAEDDLPGVAGARALVENRGGAGNEEPVLEGIEIFRCEADFFYDGGLGPGCNSKLR